MQQIKDGMINDCCSCMHFRMWKPKPEYCTVKKTCVDPLKRDEPCFRLRNGLPVFDKINGRIVKIGVTRREP